MKEEQINNNGKVVSTSRESEKSTFQSFEELLKEAKKKAESKPHLRVAEGYDFRRKKK
jgi:hypothetical protein